VTVVDSLQMAPLACLTHWYESLLYVVPVLAVGGWGWWSSRRISRSKKTPPPAPPQAGSREPDRVGV
jgi:hypothetical protein